MVSLNLIANLCSWYWIWTTRLMLVCMLLIMGELNNNGCQCGCGSRTLTDVTGRFQPFVNHRIVPGHEK